MLEMDDPSEYDIAVNAVATDSKIGVSFSYWTDCLSKGQAENMAKTFEHILNTIISCPKTDQGIQELDFFSDHSLRQVMDWNSTLPMSVERRIQDLILEQTFTRPFTTQAVCSWDAAFTYTELDDISTSLALDLMEFGVTPEVYVPICFEKSAWAVVSILAVLKAGGAFVPLDPSHPESRLKHIIDDVGATLVLCSQRYQGIFVDIAKKTFIVDHHSIGERHENRTLSQLPAPTPTNSALVLFTSGTTGLPKGTIIEHGAFCTSAIYHSKGMHIYSTSRVFQFASLTFDAGIMEILTTLIVGGTICIPSDHERMNDIPGAMKRMKVNWMFSTPSLASTLVPESLPTLKTLIMGGEAISAADILKWKGKLCLIDGYGPSETTICATTNMLLDEHGIEVNTGVTNIGKAVTGRAWVVDPRHHDKLMPVGAIGELVIESRGVARGYLNNKPKTAAAFLDNPLWLQDIEPRQRVYKTGDLVRYNSNGSLNFISRKDTQIKLNGQRIELSEIEHHVKTNLSHDMDSTVELVSPGDGTNALAVFFCLKNTAGVDSKTPTDDEIALPMCDTAQNVARDLDISLATSLPAYMIPTLFIPLTQIPLTKSSGKLDRARLRRIVETLPTSILAAYRLASDVNKRAPSTPMEKTLQQLWESVLNVTPPGSIGADDSFFRLGGDSITAMKLAVAARAEGISLAVVDIFRTPKLSEMAAQCTSTNLSEEDTWAEPEDFALLDKSGSVEELLSEVAHECHVRKELVQDAYPCSPLQEALVTLSTKESGAYVAHHIFRLSADIDIQRFQSAWQHVVDGVDILRTRVVHMRSSDFVQVVLNEQKITWNAAQSIQDAKDKGINLPASNGGTLSRYTIVNPTDLQNRFFVWSIHHALYDGWSLLAVFKMVQAAYFDKFPPLPRNSYASFVRYLLDMDMEASDDFWKSKLSGASPLQFPQIQTADCGRARQIEAFSYTSSVSQRPANRDVTIPSIIRAAWSLIVAAYSGSDDVVFGEILAGRNIPVSGITEIMGPAIAIVPTRIQINKQATLASFLQQVHKMATDVIPYQHTGLQRIKRLDADAALACDFQNLLVIQPAHEDSEAALWEPHDDGSVQSNFSTYPLIIECNAGTNEIGITAFYNKEVISSWVVERLILQLDHVLGQLSTLPASGAASKVGEIEIFSNQDKKTVQRWNGNDLECIDRCLHEAFEQQALSQPNAPAICAWDGELTYCELMEHATKLAHHLVTLGVGPEVFVPICMDRSAWVLVAILGILMAGGAYVPLDPSSPMSRHEGMIQDVKARLILCSPKYKDRYTGTLEKSFVINESVITRLAKAPHPMRSRAMSSNAAYVIFTSGSTGRPKGVVIEHRSIATNIWSWRDRIMIKPNSRVFHFGSLAFDASVMELFGALSFGACLCIPSEESRLNNVSETIDSFKPHGSS
jgi:amino acid adenylation domain-containing protein